MNGRDKIAVTWLAILFFVSWAFSLGRLIGTRFWDSQYNLDLLHSVDKDEVDGLADGFIDISESYFSNRRYLYFLPHVLGAILWWNLYFFQLIPWIRHNYKWFHRYLGRFLMVVLIIQTSSGVGLAATTHSNIIKLVSFILAIASFFCIYQALKYAICRDIPKHKYWVLRLVGYMQTISLQRFWMFVFIASHQAGWCGLYPDFNTLSRQEVKTTVHQMFDDSFVVCILHAILTTEWYLAGYQGMLEPPVKSAAYVKPELAEEKIGISGENQPLLDN